MTGGEMNATLDRVATAAARLAGMGLMAALAGCVSYSPFNSETDPTSPAAQRVDALARADGAYPRWEDFPAAPRDVPSAADIRARVVALEASEATLARQVAGIQWTLNESDGDPWARRTRARIDARLAQPADPNAMAEALAWAERLRARANPPPPVQN